MIMSIEEKAKEYANGKALEAINAAIEQAYADGYNDGMRHIENEKLEAIKDGVEYVDLGLQSGTLWSSNYIKKSHGNKDCLPYLEASKLNIPTKEQFEELCRECFPSYENTTKCHGIKFTGTNGKSIVIEYFTCNELANLDTKNVFNFWLKDNENSNERLSANIKIENNKAIPIFEKIHMGLKLPVMLVRKIDR
jgi:hypothetical protein